MLPTGLRRAELVPRQDIHDDGQNGDAGDSNGVDDNALVDHAAVPLRAVNMDTYKQLTQHKTEHQLRQKTHLGHYML